MEEKKNNKKENPEDLTFHIIMSNIRHSLSHLEALIFELKESISQFNKVSSLYSKRLFWLTIILVGLTIILAVLASIQVYLFLLN